MRYDKPVLIYSYHPPLIKVVVIKIAKTKKKFQNYFGSDFFRFYYELLIMFVSKVIIDNNLLAK